MSQVIANIKQNKTKKEKRKKQIENTSKIKIRLYSVDGCIVSRKQKMESTSYIDQKLSDL